MSESNKHEVSVTLPLKMWWQIAGFLYKEKPGWGKLIASQLTSHLRELIASESRSPEDGESRP